MDNRTETLSIDGDAEPTAVVALLADLTRIPDWAPAFADAVTRDDQSGWLATKTGQDFTVRVVTQRDAGTVDYLREIATSRMKAEPASDWYRVLAVAARRDDPSPRAWRGAGGHRRDPPGRAERADEPGDKQLTAVRVEDRPS